MLKILKEKGLVGNFKGKIFIIKTSKEWYGNIEKNC